MEITMGHVEAAVAAAVVVNFKLTCIPRTSDSGQITGEPVIYLLHYYKILVTTEIIKDEEV